MPRQRFHRASERAAPRPKHPDRERWDARRERGFTKRSHKPRVSDGDAALRVGLLLRRLWRPFATLEQTYADADRHRDAHIEER